MTRILPILLLFAILITAGYCKRVDHFHRGCGKWDQINRVTADSINEHCKIIKAHLN